MHLVGSGISPAEQSRTEVIQQSSSQCFSNSRKELEIEKDALIECSLHHCSADTSCITDGKNNTLLRIDLTKSPNVPLD